MTPFDISAAVALVLGGETAVPGGECAPDASKGFDDAGVSCETYGPGFAHAAVATGVGASFPSAFKAFRYWLATPSVATHNW